MFFELFLYIKNNTNINLKKGLLIVGCIIAMFSILYLIRHTVKRERIELQNKIDESQTKVDNLQNKYNKLKYDYTKLIDNNFKLTKKVDILRVNLNTMNNKYNNILKKSENDYIGCENKNILYCKLNYSFVKYSAIITYIFMIYIVIPYLITIFITKYYSNIW